MLTLDKADRAIIKALRVDSRLSLRKIGAKANLSAPAVASRLKHLEELNIISGYTAVLNSPLLGLSLETVIMVKVSSANSGGFEKFAFDQEAVSWCLKVTGEYSYMLKAAFANTKELKNFLNTVNENFGMTNTSLVLEETVSNRCPLLKEADET